MGSPVHMLEDEDPRQTKHTVVAGRRTLLRSPYPYSSLPNQRGYNSVDTPHLTRRTASLADSEVIYFHPQSAIIPGASTAAALRGFWQLVSMKALYNNAFHEQKQQLFTISQGILQATFSSLGADIPWYFVSDFAIKMSGMVDRGLTDTFDLVYEQQGTGAVFWVSLRVLVRARRKGTGASGSGG